MEQANITEKIQALSEISVILFHVMKLMILDTKHLEIINSTSTMLIKQT